MYGINARTNKKESPHAHVTDCFMEMILELLVYEPKVMLVPAFSGGSFRLLLDQY